jgi:antitoxin PrlF
MRVSEKGQVTIPKHLRDELGIREGTDLVFDVSNGALVMHKNDEGPSRGGQLAERLRGRGDVAMSTDEIMSLTRSI